MGFSDTDHLVEAATGMTVSDIFVDLGEERVPAAGGGCRRARPWTSRDGVVALGGGAVHARADAGGAGRAPRRLAAGVTSSDAAQRVGLNTARPLLLGNVRTTLVAAAASSAIPVYEAVATDIVDTSGRSLREVTDEVLEVVRGE